MMTTTRAEEPVFALRTYSLHDRASAEQYATVHWARHVTTMATFGITTHGVWLAADGAPTVVALVSYQGDTDPMAARTPAQGEGFRSDMAGFTMENILHVDVVLLEAASSSPLR